MPRGGKEAETDVAKTQTPGLEYLMGWKATPRDELNGRYREFPRSQLSD